MGAMWSRGIGTVVARSMVMGLGQFGEEMKAPDAMTSHLMVRAWPVEDSMMARARWKLDSSMTAGGRR